MDADPVNLFTTTALSDMFDAADILATHQACIRRECADDEAHRVAWFHCPAVCKLCHKKGHREKV